MNDFLDLSIQEVESQKQAKETKSNKMSQRPLTGYQLFLSEYFQKYPNWPFNKVVQEGAKDWKELTIPRKKPYLDLAEELKAIMLTTGVRLGTKDIPPIQPTSAVIYYIEPPRANQVTYEKPGCTGWHKYLKAQLPIVKMDSSISPYDRVKHIAKMWHRLGPYQRECWGQ